MRSELKRSEVVAAAKSYLGVPWLHQGRGRTGVDCVGLVVAVAHELDLVPSGFWLPPYRRQPTGELLEYFDRYMDRVPLSDIKEGAAVIFAFGGTPHHAGILVNSSSQAVIHAFASKRKVVVDHLESRVKGRRVIRAYDYRGIIDG